MSSTVLYYTGVGSRETPPLVCNTLTEISQFLCTKGFALRSGHAKGADEAFEAGSTNPLDQIFLPSYNFRGSKSKYHTPCSESYSIAEQFHPKWEAVAPHDRAYMARNSYQVLGPALDSPSEFLLCWTPDGATSKTSLASGGTGQAIRLANHYNIPIFNFANNDAHYKFIQYLELLYP